MFLVLVAVFVLGLLMTDMDNSPLKWAFYGWHKQLGVTLLVLGSLRLWWRLKNTVPAYPKSMPALLKTASKIGVVLLYLFMIAIPLSGFLMSIAGGHSISMFGLFDIPALGEKIPFIASNAYAFHMNFVWVFFGAHCGTYPWGCLSQGCR